MRPTHWYVTSKAPDSIQSTRVIVLTGLSGSGKSTAIRALEDLGYYCVDNLPIVLLDQMIRLCERATLSQLAVVVDVREGAFLDEYEQTLQRVRDDGYDVTTVFLKADDDVLIRRYKETRRRHPLQTRDGTVFAALEAEHEVLTSIHAQADSIIDTTGDNVHELRKRIRTYFGDEPQELVVTVQSFGFKHGLPGEADYVFNVRFLPNPYFVPELKPLSGLDESVSDFVMGHSEAEQFLEHMAGTLLYALPLMMATRSHVVVAVGCTGGQHRSVALTEQLAKRLQGGDWRVSTLHRDVVR
ncbi:MAG: UPF0042 nucleotide-binding protein [Myxococcota bacterium]